MTLNPSALYRDLNHVVSWR